MSRKFDGIAFFGLIAVIVNVVVGIVVAKGSIMQFYDVPSLIIVVLGALSSTLLTFSKDTLSGIISGIQVGLKQNGFNKVELINRFVELSKLVRKSGFLAMEEQINEIDNEYMRKGLQLVVDGMEPEVIKDIMETEINAVEERHGKVIELFNVYSGFLPAFGMIGTLIGLIIMLSDLSDSAKLGSGMAAALITTFYGSLFSNGIFIPLAKKLEHMSGEEIKIMEITLTAILDIQTGVSPRLIEEKMMTNLSPKEKQKLKGISSIQKSGDF